jgi:hypothetical protein
MQLYTKIPIRTPLNNTFSSLFSFSTLLFTSINSLGYSNKILNNIKTNIIVERNIIFIEIIQIFPPAPSLNHLLI